MFAVAVLLIGIYAIGPLLPLGLALVLWFLGGAGIFYARAAIIARSIRVVRTVRDERGPVAALWSGRTFEVRVSLWLDSWIGLPHISAADRVPFAVDLSEGDTETAGPLSRTQPREIVYRIRCHSAGRARFEGLRFRMADLQGFFFFETFLNAPLERRILPVLADAAGRAAGQKRINLLPPPGLHRLRRPGSGSELLDLRDYLPGDPPKTIAWKVSARRDRLVTKEFESEVPLACTLFVDTSASVRVGPTGRNALTRVVEIAAAVTQANAAARDLTGLCLFDEQDVSILRPARNARHVSTVLNLLADAAALVPTAGRATIEGLLQLAYAFADEVYPQLLRPEINRMPFWIARFFPRPSWAMPRPTWTDRLYAWLPRLVLGAAIFALYLIVRYAWECFSRTPSLFDLPNFDAYWSELGTTALQLYWPKGAQATFAVWLAGVLLTWLLLWQSLFPQRVRRPTWRKRLAALLSVRHSLAPGGLGALMEDDELMAQHMQRFLAEHQVPFVPPLYDELGRYQFAAPDKISVLAASLLRSVGKGHDNELFVLLVDLIELSDRLEPLLRAVRVALARHHQVVVVCPWPAGLALPGAESKPARSTGIRLTLEQTTTERFHAAYDHLRQTFARIGVLVVCAGSAEPIPLILDRMERMRTPGRRR
jgi:uncharacterized protein (DUF58 family)